MIKVLVIAANPFSDINNNGKTLKSVFSVFDKDSLFELYFRPQDNIIGDGSFASSYYAFAEMDILRSLLFFSKTCGGIQTFEKQKDYATANNRYYRFFLTSKIKNIKWLRSLLWKSRKWDTKEYREWYHSCNPDIVFALLGEPGPMYSIAKEIATDLNIPLAIYYTDDYLLHSPHKMLFDRIRYKKRLKAYKDIVDYSSIRFCIGQQMCQEYSWFFEKTFYPIMNVVDIKPLFQHHTNNEKPRLSYFGSLWLERWKMLVRLSDIVGNTADIFVYSNSELQPKMREAFCKTGIRLCPPVLGDEYQSAINDCDFLLHVESDSKDCRERTALSISTKIPEYLISGKPILAYGPLEVASMKLLADNGIGLVVSSEGDINSCKETVLSYLSNKDLQTSVAKRAHEYAVISFDKKRSSETIRAQLTRTVNEYRVKHIS